MAILTEAQAIVDGARQADYGSPLHNWTATALMMTGAARARGILKDGAEIDAELAVLFMQCVKIAREAHRPKRDTRVDMAGYAEVLDLIVTERQS